MGVASSATSGHHALRWLMTLVRSDVDVTGSGMRLTARQLNRATLARQMLLHRESSDVADAVRRIVALQAQEAASPYLGPVEPTRRLRSGRPRRCVRRTRGGQGDADACSRCMPCTPRTTRRFTTRCCAACVPRAWAIPVSQASGLSIADVDALLPHLAKFVARPRTGAEIEDLLEDRLGERKPGVWWALRTFAPLHHAPTGGPWSFGRTRRRSSPLEPSRVRSPRTNPCNGWSCDIYGLRSGQRGGHRAVHPAQAAEWRCGQPAGPGRQGRRARRPRRDNPVRRARGAAAGADTVAPPRLLPMWDSILLAYSDRSRVIPPDYRPLIIRRNGDVLPALLLDGYVAGVWRPVEGGIEATAFHRLDEEVWNGLASGGQRAGGIPRGSRAHRLPPLRPLVDQADAEHRGPRASALILLHVSPNCRSAPLPTFAIRSEQAHRTGCRRR